MLHEGQFRTNSERLCEHLRGFLWPSEAISEFGDCFVPPATSARNDVKLLVLGSINNYDNYFKS